MSKSLRSLEGYLLIDNRLAGEGIHESPTATCSHCHRQVIFNPGRTREREFCSSCHHYICDECAKIRLTAPKCETFNAVLDRKQEEAFRDEQNSRGLILISS